MFMTVNQRVAGSSRAKHPYQTLTFLFLKVTQPTFSPQIGRDPQLAYRKTSILQRPCLLT